MYISLPTSRPRLQGIDARAVDAARALLSSAHADAAWIGFAASSADSPRVTCTDTPHYDASGSAVRDSHGNGCGFYSVECVIDPNTGQPVRR